MKYLFRFRKEVFRAKIPVNPRKSRVSQRFESNRNTGENLVPKQKNEAQKTSEKAERRPQL